MPQARIPIQPGQTFGSLAVLADAGSDARRKRLWRCQCSCGNVTTVRASDLKNGRAWRCRSFGDASAGILRSKYKDVIRDGTAKTSAEYQAWSSMRWSARDLGVPLEPDWENFAVFYAELGRRPDDEESWVLGRIDSNLGYVRGNVQWQPIKQRMRHKVTSLCWHVEGTRYPSANAAAEALGLSRTMIRNWCQGYLDRKTRKRGECKQGCWTEPQYPKSE